MIERTREENKEIGFTVTWKLVWVFWSKGLKLARTEVSEAGEGWLTAGPSSWKQENRKYRSKWKIIFMFLTQLWWFLSVQLQVYTNQHLSKYKDPRKDNFVCYDPGLVWKEFAETRNFLSALSETWIFLYSTVRTDFSLFPLIPKKVTKFLSIEKKK